MDIHQKIDAFLRRTKMPEGNFGRLALNSTSFVSALRNGRRPTRRTIARLEAFMENYSE